MKSMLWETERQEMELKKSVLNGLCLLLTILMLGSLFSTAGHASAEETQIVTQGTETTAENGAVKVSKTIVPTAEENIFTITLKIVTTEALQEMSLSPDAAVVLVMDISNSMDEKIGGKKGSTKMQAARNAATSFIESFAKESQTAEADTIRKVGIVTFGSTSSTVQELTDIKTGKDQLKTAVTRISTPWQDFMGGTNIEAGLTQAYTMLNASGVAKSNCYILLLSDGKPTYHNTQNGYSDGGSGNSTEHADHSNVFNGSTGIADQISKAGMTVLSVYIGNENDRISCTTCSLNESIKNWLGRFSDAVYTTAEEENLIAHFENISKLITIYANAWRVEDPMGQYIEYQGLTSVNNTVLYYNDTHTLRWNLRADTPLQTTGQEKTYAISYRIKLLNTAAGFTENTPYNTNGSTVLYYFLSEHAQEANPTLKQIQFNVPQVKGYLADIVFTKIAADTQKPLAGAVFSLRGTNGVNMTATSAADGSVIFLNVPSGYSYSLTETAAPYGYQADSSPRQVTVSYDVPSITGLSNGVWYNEVPVINITAEKTWADDNNNDGLRPEFITVQLLKDGDPYGDPVMITADQEWTYTWNGVPQYAGGKEIVWSVREHAVAGYTPAYDGLKITNTHENETTALTFLKEWNDDDNNDGLRPDFIILRVTGSVNGDTVYANQVVLSEDNGWTDTLTQLPKYKNGALIQYTCTEDPIEGYSASYSTTQQGTILITNTHESETISLTLMKEWNDNDNNDGKRPESVTVRIAGSVNGDTVYTSQTVLSKDNNWTDTLTQLPKYENGALIQYACVEDSVEGYSAAYNVTENSVFIITNTHESETVSLAFLKEWHDDNNRDGLRPDFVTIRISGSADGDTVYSGQVTLSKDNQWSAVLGQLPKFHNGVSIQYSYQEDPVEGYSASYTTTRQGTILITNTHEPHAIPKNDGDKPLFLYGVLFITAAAGLLVIKKKYKKE